MMFLLFFFIIDLYFLISTVIAETFIPAAQLVISTLTRTNEANAKIETEPITIDDRISKCSI